MIHPDRALDFIAQMKVENLWGVGKKTAEKMHQMGIINGSDLRSQSLERLTSEFGKMGKMFYNFARGIDDRPIIAEWERKSVSCERTFAHDIRQQNVAETELYNTVEELERRIAKNEFVGRTLTLKVKFQDFQQITRSVTVNKNLQTRDDILPLAKQLLEQIDLNAHPIRLLGLGVSNNRHDDTTNYQQWIQLELNFKE